MKKTLKVSILLFVALVGLSLVVLKVNGRATKEKIEIWENQGNKYVSKINRIVSSNLSWDVKKRALFAVEKILDESSIPVLIEQLHYQGHWWQCWWDYQDKNSAAIYRESIMYSLAMYKDKAFDYLINDLKNKNAKNQDLKDTIIAIGLLGTETAIHKLERMKKDLYD